MLDDISPTFCVVPWIHLGTRPDGKLNLCCTASGELLKNDDDQFVTLDQQNWEGIWNCKSLRDARSAFAQGRQIKGCRACYLNEENGRYSARQRTNQTWEGHVGRDEIIRRVKESEALDWQLNSQPIYLDLRLSNKCNLKCRMCFPVYSQFIAKEFEQIMAAKLPYPETYKPALDRVFEWSETELFEENMTKLIPYCRELYFAGGEPMLMKGVETTLQKAVDLGVASKMIVSFHTNCTTWNEKITRLLGQFKFVHMNCSIDGVHEVDQYIRHPTRFTAVEDTFVNYLKMAATEHKLMPKVACSVSWQNLFDLPRLIRWYGEMTALHKPRHHGITINVVNYPSYLSPKMIPRHLRADAYAALEASAEILREFNIGSPINFEELKGIHRIIENADGCVNPKERVDLIQHTDTLDKIRNENLRESIPHAYPVYSHYRNNQVHEQFAHSP